MFISEKESEERKAVSKIRTNSKFFFSYAKRNKTLSRSIAKLKFDRSVTTDRKDISDILQDKFVENFSVPKDVPEVHIDYSNQDDDTLDYLTFTEADIIAAIDEIPSSSSPGIDGITAKALKSCKYALATPLRLLWEKSLNEGVIPAECKSSLIIPLHKGGARDDPRNYRPISLLPHIIKIFERVIKKKIVHHLESKNLLKAFQYGFRKGRSCLSQLMDHYTNIITALESGKTVDVVYLDFAKAFDKVDHKILLSKLKSLKIDGKLLRWLQEFLKDRNQTVLVEGTRSNSADVISGVPQGTVLGPLLFIIMINDLPDHIEYCQIKSFADDTKILKEISSSHDFKLMEEDLKRVYSYAANENLSFNANKFQLLRYSRGNDANIDIQHTYTSPDKGIIAKSRSTKDLGVIMSENGLFTEHIMDLKNRIKKLSGWVLRTFRSRCKTVILTLWKSFLLTRIEYASPLWHPSKIGEMQEVEGLQRTFTSKITSLKHLSYWERLETLGLYSIERRFERYQVIFAWKISEGIVIPERPLEMTELNTRTGRKFVISHGENLKQPFYRMKRVFNSLPKDIRNTTRTSPDVFKRRLDRFLRTIPDEPNVPGYTKYQTSVNSIPDKINSMAVGGEHIVARLRTQ